MDKYYRLKPKQWGPKATSTVFHILLPAKKIQGLNEKKKGVYYKYEGLGSYLRQ